MSKFIKKILNFQKRKNGNISILVLVMSLAIILLTTAMVGYIFHDIGFTELDKGESRAFYFADSGLSNMYYKIDQGLIPDLPPGSPESPNSYTEPVGAEGSFNVEYYMTEYYVGKKYTITSTGIDSSSGKSRTVRVEVLCTNPYDFIFSGKASGAEIIIPGQTKITGPFITTGDLEFITGTSSFRKGPLIVKGNITISGNSSIGEETEYIHEDRETYGPIILYLGGLFNDEPFDPLNPPDNVYVSEYHNDVIDIKLPIIDSSYVDAVVESGAQEIPGNLSIRNNIIRVNGRPVEGYEGLKFNNGILEINGNIVVHGDIEIGSSWGWSQPIYYSGNANLISTGNITVRSQVRPKDMNNFPSSDLMALISLNNIDLNLTNANGGTYDDPKAAAMLIASNKVETFRNTFLRGGTVSYRLTLGTNTTIYYETGIGEYLNAGVPGFGENTITKMEWQEIIPD